MSRRGGFQAGFEQDVPDSLEPEFEIAKDLMIQSAGRRGLSQAATAEAYRFRGG